MNAQADALRAGAEARGGRAHRVLPNVAVIAAGKGGVGTSTVAALLAAACARSGRSTLLVDAAGSGPVSLPSILAVDASDDAEAVRVLAPHLSFRAMSAEIAGSAERRSRARRLSAGYGDHDLVVIDAGATLDALTAVLGAGAGRLIAVTSPDRLGVVATYALLKYLAERFPALPTGVLVNRADPGTAAAAFGRIAEGVESFLGRSAVLAGSFPPDAEVEAAGETGTSPLGLAGSAPHAAALLADVLALASSGQIGRLRLLKTT